MTDHVYLIHNDEGTIGAKLNFLGVNQASNINSIFSDGLIGLAPKDPSS